MQHVQSHGIKRSSQQLALIFFWALPTAWAQPHSLEAVTAFVQHPTNCLINTGGSTYTADQSDVSYSRALAAALTAIGGSSAASIAEVQRACASHLFKTTSAKTKP